MQLLKYLPKHAWDVTVLTPEFVHVPQLHDRISVPSFDPESMALVPAGIDIYRTSSFPSIVRDHLSNPTVKRLGKALLQGESIRLWAARMLSHPSWLPFAVGTGWRICRQIPVDLIVATGPPFTNHLIGAVLKRLLDVPLVVEFRDAWTSEPRFDAYSAKRRLLEKWAERFMVESSDRVVAVTEDVRADFVQRYPGSGASHFACLPNGFDRAEFEGLLPIPRPVAESCRWFVYTGGLGGIRNPKHLLKGIRCLLDRNPRLADRLAIHIVGRCSRLTDGTSVDEQVRQFDLTGVVTVVGEVTRQESLRYQMAADVLLSIVGDIPEKYAWTYGIGAKLLDYSCAGRPVLNIGSPGATADFIEETNLGKSVSLRNPEEIAAAIEMAIHRYGEYCQMYTPNRLALSRYDVRSIAQDFADLLNGCANELQKG